MFVRSVAVAVIGMFGSDLAVAQGESGCAALGVVVERIGHCADAPGGVALAASAERAAALAAIGRDGEGRFQRHFERATPRYAIVESETGNHPPDLRKSFDEAGYVWQLPWLPPQAVADAMHASIRRGVEAKAEASGLTPEATERLVAAALEQQKARVTPEAMTAREQGVLPHELGHGWFMRGWWPTVRGGSGHYGGPAPDWMDELAAVLIEDDALADQRREGFATRLAGTSAARDEVLDLKRFLTIDHPAAAQARTLNESTPQQSGVRVLSGAEAQVIANTGLIFYLQSRLFADYLIERAGPSRAFISAAEAFAGGMTTKAWLAQHGASLGIATDLDALEKDWQAWVIARQSDA